MRLAELSIDNIIFWLNLSNPSAVRFADFQKHLEGWPRGEAAAKQGRLNHKTDTVRQRYIGSNPVPSTN